MMDEPTFKSLLEEHTIELTNLYSQFVEIRTQRDATRWWHHLIRRDLEKRLKRIVERVDAIEIEREAAYEEYILELQTEKRFQAIIEQNEWKI